MSLVCCNPGAALVGPHGWLPDAAFDYAWGMFGCNQLRCAACGQRVRASLPAGGAARHYACACQAHDQAGDYHLLGADQGQLHELVTRWRCGGHPRLALPVELDGIEIPAVGAFAAIVARTLTHPPFVAPGFTSPAFWVDRLYRLLPGASQQAAVGLAVAAQLASGDPATVRAATDFFFDLPRAAGADQLAVIAERARDALRALPDPAFAEQSLYDRVLDVIGHRLGVVRNDGAPIDPAALALARRALLAGDGIASLLTRIASDDTAWFIAHAAELVRARPDELDFIVGTAGELPAAERGRALHAIRAAGDAAAHAVDALGDGDDADRDDHDTSATDD